MPEAKQLFVNLLKKYPVLFSNTKLPDIQKQKTAALNELSKELGAELGLTIGGASLLNKIRNLKRYVKYKSAMVQTGKFQYIPRMVSRLAFTSMSVFQAGKHMLKPHEQQMLDLIQDDDCPRLERVPKRIYERRIFHCLSVAILMLGVFADVCGEATTAAAGDFETAATRGFSTAQLKRLVLVKQLQLIEMQMRLMEAQNAKTTESKVLEFHQF